MLLHNTEKPFPAHREEQTGTEALTTLGTVPSADTEATQPLSYHKWLTFPVSSHHRVTQTKPAHISQQRMPLPQLPPAVLRGGRVTDALEDTDYPVLPSIGIECPRM